MLFYRYSGMADGSASWWSRARRSAPAGTLGTSLRATTVPSTPSRTTTRCSSTGYSGMADGSADWSVQGKEIGTGWNFKQVFAGDRGDHLRHSGRRQDALLPVQRDGRRFGQLVGPGQGDRHQAKFRQVFAGDNECHLRAPRTTATCFSTGYSGMADGSASWSVQGKCRDRWPGNSSRSLRAIAGPAPRHPGRRSMLFYRYSGMADGSTSWLVQAKRSALAGTSSRYSPDPAALSTQFSNPRSKADREPGVSDRPATQSPARREPALSHAHLPQLDLDSATPSPAL